jgi:hypothetical protein
MLVMALPRGLDHGAMLLVSHAGDGVVEATPDVALPTTMLM